MTEFSALKSIRPLVMTPAYGASVSAGYTRRIAALVNFMWQVGAGMDLRLTNGSSLITRARNEMLVDFLVDPSFTHLVWIDADISFDPADLARMLMPDLDVVAAAYPIKDYRFPIDIPTGTTSLDRHTFESLATIFPVNTASGAELPPVGADGLIEVAEAPSGFMAIKRHVFDRLKQAYPHLRYAPDRNWPPEYMANSYLFFDTMKDPESGRYLSEDFAFCKRWRDISGRVFIDTTVRLGHTGTHEFRGSLSDALLPRFE